MKNIFHFATKSSKQQVKYCLVCDYLGNFHKNPDFFSGFVGSKMIFTLEKLFDDFDWKLVIFSILNQNQNHQNETDFKITQFSQN